MKNTLETEYVENILPPIVSEEDQLVIDKFFSNHPELKSEVKELPNPNIGKFFIGTAEFDPNEPWQQTYSGIRFTTLNPNPDAIVIQDIARGLSMQCRFTGQVKNFYSIAQHSVLVSYVCDRKDRLWALLHDASEAYLTDLSRPIKYTDQFSHYREVEKKLMNAICKRFNLDLEEPLSVKVADKLLLATEGRDILTMVRKDWFNGKPLPFKIEPLLPDAAEKLFMNRFYELMDEDWHD